MTKVAYVFGWFSVDCLPEAVRNQLYPQTDQTYTIYIVNKNGGTNYVEYRNQRSN
jgi:hypothetical protein